MLAIWSSTGLDMKRWGGLAGVGRAGTGLAWEVGLGFPAGGARGEVTGATEVVAGVGRVATEAVWQDWQARLFVGLVVTVAIGLLFVFEAWLCAGAAEVIERQRAEEAAAKEAAAKEAAAKEAAAKEAAAEEVAPGVPDELNTAFSLEEGEGVEGVSEVPEELNTGFYLYETSHSAEMAGLDLADEIRERRRQLDQQARVEMALLPAEHRLAF